MMVVLATNIFYDILVCFSFNKKFHFLNSLTINYIQNQYKTIIILIDVIGYALQANIKQQNTI